MHTVLEPHVLAEHLHASFTRKWCAVLLVHHDRRTVRTKFEDELGRDSSRRYLQVDELVVVVQDVPHPEEPAELLAKSHVPFAILGQGFEGTSFLLCLFFDVVRRIEAKA